MHFAGLLTQRLAACSARKFIKKKPETSARNQRKKEARRREAGQDGGDGGRRGGSRAPGSESHESDDDAQRVGSKWKKTKYVRRHRFGECPRRPGLSLRSHSRGLFVPNLPIGVGCSAQACGLLASAGTEKNKKSQKVWDSYAEAWDADKQIFGVYIGACQLVAHAALAVLPLPSRLPCCACLPSRGVEAPCRANRTDHLYTLRARAGRARGAGRGGMQQERCAVYLHASTRWSRDRVPCGHVTSTWS